MHVFVVVNGLVFVLVLVSVLVYRQIPPNNGLCASAVVLASILVFVLVCGLVLVLILVLVSACELLL